MSKTTWNRLQPLAMFAVAVALICLTLLVAKWAGIDLSPEDLPSPTDMVQPTTGVSP